VSARRPYVANIDFPAFYAPAFGGNEALSREFYAALTDRTAKIIIHQAARMLWLSDQIDEVARGRPALQILFFIIAAEAVSKLQADFEGEGQSRFHVRRFFLELCSDELRSRLAPAFQSNGSWLTPTEAVDLLYDLRCDVAHRGQYYNLHLPRPESDESHQFVTWKGKQLIAFIPATQLRQIVLEGAVLAAKRRTP